MWRRITGNWNDIWNDIWNDMKPPQENSMSALAAIRSYAAATDGGSLAFEGEDAEGGLAWYMVNRSIAARGTLEFNAISKNAIRLDDDDRATLFQNLSKLQKSADADLASFIDHFMK
jgi:hypothetical protein